MANVSGRTFRGVDLLAGGVPCPPFSIAGRQLGADDERDLFPQMLRLTREIKPRAVLIENVRGLATKRFDSYRIKVIAEFAAMGYRSSWRVLNASNYGVAQLRPRFLLVALRDDLPGGFQWPRPSGEIRTVGETLRDLMASAGWPGAERWADKAKGVAPTIVGGSKKHGGPDLGPTRARAQWAELGVDGLGVADSPPGPDFPIECRPRLTMRMVARLQGFPDNWCFAGGKTTAYRQVGNAFPPPVARAIGCAVAGVLSQPGEPPAEQKHHQLSLSDIAEPLPA